MLHWRSFEDAHTQWDGTSLGQLFALTTKMVNQKLCRLVISEDGTMVLLHLCSRHSFCGIWKVSHVHWAPVRKELGAPFVHVTVQDHIHVFTRWDVDSSFIYGTGSKLTNIYAF